MNTTIQDLAKNWIENLDIAEYHKLAINNILSDEEIENIFYQEVIVKWWNSIDTFKMIVKYNISVDANFEKTIPTIYLKEHIKEQPLKRGMLSRKIDTCSHFNIEVGCDLENCMCENEQPQSVLKTIDVEEDVFDFSFDPLKDKPAYKIAAIKSVTNCPTCGVECTIGGDRTTHYYIPIISQTKAIEDNVWDEAFSRFHKNDIPDFVKLELKQHYSLIRK